MNTLVRVIIFSLCILISCPGFTQVNTDSLQGIYLCNKVSMLDYGQNRTELGVHPVFIYKATIEQKLHVKYHPYQSFEELQLFEQDSAHYLFTIDSTYYFKVDSLREVRAGTFNGSYLSYRHRPAGPSNSINYYYDGYKAEELTFDTLVLNDSLPMFLFPNPSENFIEIGNGRVEEYEIFSLKGDLIISGQAENTIDIRQLKTGPYVLVINSKFSFNFHKY